MLNLTMKFNFLSPDYSVRANKIILSLCFAVFFFSFMETQKNRRATWERQEVKGEEIKYLCSL